jgi:hypothetical protein
MGRALGRKAGKETVASNLDPQIERRPIGALRPYERNARKHPPEQVAQIAASITEWGWTMPVLTRSPASLRLAPSSAAVESVTRSSSCKLSRAMSFSFISDIAATLYVEAAVILGVNRGVELPFGACSVSR